MPAYSRRPFFAWRVNEKRGVCLWPYYLYDGHTDSMAINKLFLFLKRRRRWGIWIGIWVNLVFASMIKIWSNYVQVCVYVCKKGHFTFTMGLIGIIRDLLVNL